MHSSKVVEQLLEGREVKYRPQGNSMTPRVYSGQLVTVSPLKEDDVIERGDIVLCKVSGRHFLHLVTAVESDGRYQISNNHGHINGYATRKNVFGRLTMIEP